MSDLIVNAEQVVATANRIKTINDQIRAEFADVQKAINSLDGEWDGSAASNAMAKFASIRNAYCDARYNVVDNYVAFLHQQVGEGYTQTESVNKSLADAFK